MLAPCGVESSTTSAVSGTGSDDGSSGGAGCAADPGAAEPAGATTGCLGFDAPLLNQPSANTATAIVPTTATPATIAAVACFCLGSASGPTASIVDFSTTLPVHWSAELDARGSGGGAVGGLE